MSQGRTPAEWPQDKIQVASNSKEMYHKMLVDHHRHPGVTKMNINEEAYRHPPHNLEDGIETGGRPHTQRGALAENANKDRRPEPTRLSEEVLGTSQQLGRDKKADNLAEMVQEDSVHA
ncbi:hypothetical protein NMY22_g11918 [Coprinellus aureogranulatus]|nr:hypothetical protein NMY22_g11918 [Coprinellus aureogranulatus]